MIGIVTHYGYISQQDGAHIKGTNLLSYNYVRQLPCGGYTSVRSLANTVGIFKYHLGVSCRNLLKARKNTDYWYARAKLELGDLALYCVLFKIDMPKTEFESNADQIAVKMFKFRLKRGY